MEKKVKINSAVILNTRIGIKREALKSALDFARDNSDESLSKAVAFKACLRDISEELARNESTAKQIQALIAFVCESAGEERMDGAFRRSDNGATYKVTDMSELHKRCSQSGVTDDAFFAACGGISSKIAAELLGLSEDAFLEAHGDIVKKTEKSPTWKAV